MRRLMWRWIWAAPAALAVALAVTAWASVTGPLWNVTDVYYAPAPMAPGTQRGYPDLNLEAGVSMVWVGALAPPPGIRTGPVRPMPQSGPGTVGVTVTALRPGRYVLPPLLAVYWSGGLLRFGFSRDWGYVWVAGRYPWTATKPPVAYLTVHKARALLRARRLLANGARAVLSTVGQLQAVVPGGFGPPRAALDPAELIVSGAAGRVSLVAVNLVTGAVRTWTAASAPDLSPLGTVQNLS